MGILLNGIPENLYCSLFNQNTIRKLDELLSPLKEININYAIFEMGMLDTRPKYDVGVYLCLDGEKKLLINMRDSTNKEDMLVTGKKKLIKIIDLHLNSSTRRNLMGIEFDISDAEKSINPNVFFEVKNDFLFLPFINILFDYPEKFNCYIRNIIHNMEGIKYLGAMISRTPGVLKVVETRQEMNFIIDRVLNLKFILNNSTLCMLNSLKREEVKIARLCYNITSDGLENKFDIEIFDKPLKVLRSFCKIVDVNHEKMLLLEKWSKSNRNDNFEYDCSHIKLCFKFGNLYNIKGYFHCDSLFKPPGLFRNMRIKDFSAIYKTKNELRL